MKRYRITLEPESAFGAPLKGDTLFGQLCWAILNRYGEERLEELLSNYSIQPFAVCSDGFPSGYFLRPSLPGEYFDIADNEDRKTVKKKRWIPLDCLMEPVSTWLARARSDAELLGKDNSREQPHNSIDRLTGTTGEGFAPYSRPQVWYMLAVSDSSGGGVSRQWAPSRFDIYLLLDEAQLALSDIETLLADIGAFGYGRDASIGLGKFMCSDFKPCHFSANPDANACLTLAPCAPQGLGLDSGHSYYNVFTRFGRHGDVAVHGKQGPFKTPVLLADTAAVFSPIPDGQDYVGQGLGGAGQLSRTIPATMHQGYAPYIPVHLPRRKQEAT